MSETVPLDLSVDRVRVFLDGEIVGSLTLSPAKQWRSRTKARGCPVDSA